MIGMPHDVWERSSGRGLTVVRSWIIDDAALAKRESPALRKRLIRPP